MKDKDYEEFYDFMQQYTDFYYEVSANEEKKMDALATDDLTQINKILSEYQIFIKKTEQYEKRRLELFKRLGLSGKTFKEIVDMETGECHDELENLFFDFSESVSRTRDFNRRSLEIARENIRTSGMLGYDDINDPACYNNSGVLAQGKIASVNLLDRKA